MATTGGGHSSAIAALHYIGPIVTGTYFVAAKTTAGCLLQHPSAHAGSRSRRYAAISLQAAVTVTAAAEGLSAIIQYLQQPGWYASQDYIVYLILLFAVHGSLVLGILENKKPLWHPYLGAWLLALCFEIPLFTLQITSDLPESISGLPENDYSRARMALCVARAALLVVVFLVISAFALHDRPKSVKLDAESEALLQAGVNGSANGSANGKKPKRKSTSPSPRDSVLCNGASGSASNTDAVDSDTVKDDDDDVDIDSDSEEPERDKELKKQQQKRLEESGSWLGYIKEFRIFVPMLLPWKDRLVQACFAVIALIIVAERALNILVPRQLGIIVTELSQTGMTGQVPWKSIGLWVLYASLDSPACLPLIKQLAQIPIEQYGYKQISTTAFSHIMGLSMDFHNEKDCGELIRAVDQGTTLQNLVDFFLFEVAPMFFDLIVAFVYVSLLFDVYMAMILIGVGIAYVWIGTKVTAWSMRHRRNFNTAWRNESKVQTEAIVNWSTVSHFNRGQYETQRYVNTVESFNLAEWKYYLAYHLGAAAQSFIMLVGRLTAVMLAATRVAQGRAPVGSFVTLVTYWRSIEYPLANVSYSVRRVSQMLIDSERLLQLLTTKATVTNSPTAKDIDISEGEVVFDHVNFSYDPRRATLKDVNFRVKPGQTVALVGETGGGKSTILKLLYRYYDVAEGAIRIDGQDIREVTLDSMRDSFGMVPQDPSLFNVSIMENIRYARLDATDQEVHDACRAAAIHDKIMSFPDGYKATVGERGVKLSGGELQRVAIARAILRRPKIVLLDEATSQIDAETEALIQEAFKRLTADRTTFIVAHRLSTIQHADLILVINDGQIVERGTHDELFRKKGKYVALWSKQLSKEVRDMGNTLDVTKKDEDLIALDELQSASEGASSSTRRDEES
ncbi:Heavy metal tolerance protein [Pseudocercospora fuligena]|uniref:Heavy metal tolerance protein n=1 Tax=Pseudocercospora fuligena TaxID=685502 RepID=A0A8H6RLR4_9PEZI|nr:Heavy metal tolerance protein [Pseudocercospora fuligena]